MARSVSEELVCDICGSNVNVESFTLVTPEGARVLDLCQGDAKGLRKYWNAGSAEPRKKVTGTKRPQGHAVIPVD